jgi:hypothetical protein
VTRSNNYSTTVYTTSASNVYSYKRRNLVLAYSIAFAIATLCIIVGFRAVLVNGVVHNSSFSTTLSTTRNPAFDVLTLGASLGAVPIEKQLLDIKIRFGLLHSEDSKYTQETETESSSNGIGRAAFGLQGTTSIIKKGEICQ